MRRNEIDTVYSSGNTVTKDDINGHVERMDKGKVAPVLNQVPRHKNV
jgi:hypothetical protein